MEAAECTINVGWVLRLALPADNPVIVNTKYIFVVTIAVDYLQANDKDVIERDRLANRTGKPRDRAVRESEFIRNDIKLRREWGHSVTRPHLSLLP